MSGVTVPEPVRSSPDGPKTKPPAKRTPEERARQEREPALRPLFGTTETPGYAGVRFVAVGCSPAQVQALRQAAEAAGIREGRS